MSNIQRSRSAPQVGPLEPFLVSDQARSREHTLPHPRIRRHHTSLALTELATPSSSRSGYQTPRADRTEDPFSLGGFFPSQLAPAPVYSDAEWAWLRTADDDVGDVVEGDSVRGRSDGTSAAYRGPDSNEEEEEDEEDGFTPRNMLDNAEDLKMGEMIMREDKLGVLSIRESFSCLFFLSFFSFHFISVLFPFVNLFTLTFECHAVLFFSWAVLCCVHVNCAVLRLPNNLPTLTSSLPHVMTHRAKHLRLFDVPDTLTFVCLIFFSTYPHYSCDTLVLWVCRQPIVGVCVG